MYCVFHFNLLVYCNIFTLSFLVIAFIMKTLIRLNVVYYMLCYVYIYLS